MKRPGLYLLADPEVAGRRLGEAVGACVRAGVEVVQYRDKVSPASVFVEQAARIQDLCRPFNCTFLINDRIDVAGQLHADGVHLGLGDGSVEDARTRLGDRIVGATSHSMMEARNAWEAGASYVSVGPMYPTTLKPDLPANGFEWVGELIQTSPVPVVAIGGITRENLIDVARTGVRWVAVCRALLQAEDPEAEVKAWLELTEQAENQSG